MEYLAKTEGDDRAAASAAACVEYAENPRNEPPPWLGGVTLGEILAESLDE